ncbi:hypothetical protein [Rothia dentocariosa]|uniref:hypothetical protein n=1 Tax=Rothia dentocariosa TaxID=2047 RepID=UPI00242F389D|nr:hypothetical protein [Rothia dentocariosa]
MTSHSDKTAEATTAEAYTVIDPELAGSASDETAETEQHVQGRKETGEPSRGTKP